MRDADWNKIKERFEVLQNQLEPDEILSGLYQSGVLSDDDQERIMGQKTRRDKATLLLQTLRTKELQDDDVYSVFLSNLTKTQAWLADQLKPPGKVRRPMITASESAKGRNVDYLQSLDTEELCQFLEPVLKKINITDFDRVLQSFKEEKITGRVFLKITPSELKEICPYLKFGDRKSIVLERDELIQQNQFHAGATEKRTHDGRGGIEQREYARKFDTSAGYTEKYQKGKVLENLQTGVGHLTDPIHVCIPLGGDIDVNSALETIGWETVKFSAACMNDRTNGTIHFGVYDGTDGTHAHGEVAGLTHLEQKDCEESIESWMDKGFPRENHDVAKSCIRPSKYVDVISNGECFGFVLEVDVNPKACLVQKEIYYVTDQFTVQGKKEPKHQLFRFKGGIPVKQDASGIIHLTKSIDSLNKQRTEAERVPSTKSHHNESLFHQLQDFFCDGDTKMGDVYPVLVINSIDKNVTMEELDSKFSFLADINWICIFDFDPMGCSTGIYNYLTKKQKKEFKLKLTDDFDQRGSEHPQMHVNDDKMHEEMSSSHLTPWIFCNGYETIDKPELGVMEWKKQRSEGFKEAVRYFSYEIPRERAKVVYLLLSKDYSVMLEAVEEVSLKFQNQWMVIAENESVTGQWQEQMICRNIAEKVALDRCVLTGYRWEDITACMNAITGDSSQFSSECSLITHLGTFTQLPKNNQNKLCDLEILSSSECTDMDKLGEEEQTKIAKEHETRFYQGHPPSWVNFYQGIHVLRRKHHDELAKNVDRVLNGDIPDNVNIGRVTIYHQPGSGGTTTAKQVLWDVRDKFRCCTLKTFSKESHNQIVELWKFGADLTRALPVLVMVDNLEEDKLHDLIESLQSEANKHIQGMSRVMCVLLLCHRQTTLPPEKERVRFVLRQELHPEEKNWFQSKYNDLADSFKRQKGPNPRHLLSLNIMKENFNERYIENTVTEILRDIAIPEEKSLIKYVSLLNAYDQQFRGVPVPCFDFMMARRTRTYGKRWESCLSSSANMLLTKSNTKITSLRVINPLLCKWVLGYLIQENGQSLGDAYLEFLYSDACKFRYRDMAFKNLFTILRDIMKSRELTVSGKQAMFSRLIQELYDTQDVDTAAEILELMFGKTTDPYIAQQLARLYIACENWTKATEFANEATSLRPDSSYLWDTHGQIFKFKLSKLMDIGMSGNRENIMKSMQEAVEFAYEGTTRFLKVQALSCSERSSDPNTAGYFGEIDICILLLETLCLVPLFGEKSELQMFLNGRSQTPDELALLTGKQLNWLRGLQGKVLTTLRKLEDETDRYILEDVTTSSSRSRHFIKGNMDRIRQTLGNYFGDDHIPDLAEAKTLSADKRRRIVRRFGINSLKSMLKLVKEESSKEKISTIYQLSQLNTDSQQCLPYDCRIALGSALVLLRFVESPSDLPMFEQLLRTSTDLFNMKHNGNYIDLEPYLYFLLLHWPTPSRKQFKTVATPDILLGALNRWNNAYLQKYPKDKRSHFSGRDRPFFFLTNMVGIQSVIHIDQLKERRGGKQAYRNYQLGKILGTRVNRQLLQRFNGILTSKGWEVSIQLETPKGNKLSPVKIPLHTREARESLSNKKVYFVLGFGWSGPMACDVQTETDVQEKGTQYTAVQQAANHPSLNFITTADLYHNITHQIMTIDQHLLQIEHIKRVPRNQRLPQQVQLIQQEVYLINRRRSLFQERQARCLDFL